MRDDFEEADKLGGINRLADKFSAIARLEFCITGMNRVQLKIQVAFIHHRLPFAMSLPIITTRSGPSLLRLIKLLCFGFVVLLYQSLQVLADRLNSHECIIDLNHQNEYCLKTAWEILKRRDAE